MPMTMEAIVKDVEPKSIQNGARTIYDVVIHDGTKWTAWEKDLAERAWNLKGVPALLQVDVKENGNFTNRTLKSIDAKVTEGFGPALTAMEAGIGRTFTEPYVDPSPGPGGFPQTHGGTPAYTPMPTQAPREGSGTEKDVSIWRQVATKVSAALMPGDRAEFWDNVEALQTYYATGIIPGKLLREIEQAAQAAPSQVTGLSGPALGGPTFSDITAPVPDDDIPF